MTKPYRIHPGVEQEPESIERLRELAIGYRVAIREWARFGDTSNEEFFANLANEFAKEHLEMLKV